MLMTSKLMSTIWKSRFVSKIFSWRILRRSRFVPNLWISFFACKVCLRLHQEFVSLLNIIFFSFLWSRNLLSRKAEENPLSLWRELSSDTSNAVMAGNCFSCFYILDKVLKMNFLVFWNGNRTVDPFLLLHPMEKRKGFFISEIRKRKIVLKLNGNVTNKCSWSLMEMQRSFYSGGECSNQTWQLNLSEQESSIFVSWVEIHYWRILEFQPIHSPVLTFFCTLGLPDRDEVLEPYSFFPFVKLASLIL